MAIVLFDPEWIIARLKTEVSALKFVGGSAELAVAEADLKQTPSAYVFEAGDDAGQNTTGTMVVSQQNKVRFVVAIATMNFRDSRGQHAGADMLAIRSAIHDALHGWSPDDEFDPIEKRSGRLIKMSKAVLWRREEFVTSHLIRSV